MKTIPIEEQKELQLNILKSIHHFCTEQGINYTLAYGTLIGALRHDGFIPWDDDIDIAMPREDYEKFIHSYKSEIYKVHSLETDSDYLNPIVKVEDTRTLIEEEGSMVNLGVFVDVFPLDPLYDTTDECSLLFHKVTFYRRLLAFRTLTSRYFQCWWKRWIFLMGSFFLRFLSKRWLAERLDRLAKSGHSDARYWGMFAGCMKYALIERDDLQHYIYHKFEDSDFLVIQNYDSWLRQVYGDYMTPPPLDKQKSVHYFNNVYWKD